MPSILWSGRFIDFTCISTSGEFSKGYGVPLPHEDGFNDADNPIRIPTKNFSKFVRIMFLTIP